MTHFFFVIFYFCSFILIHSKLQHVIGWDARVCPLTHTRTHTHTHCKVDFLCLVLPHKMEDKIKLLTSKIKTFKEYEDATDVLFKYKISNCYIRVWVIFTWYHYSSRKKDSRSALFYLYTRKWLQLFLRANFSLKLSLIYHTMYNPWTKSVYATIIYQMM